MASTRSHLQLFPNPVDRITDLLFIGSRSCNTPALLGALGFTHVIDISGLPTGSAGRDSTATRLFLQLDDDEDAALSSVLSEFVSFVRVCDASRGDRLLVHCDAGVSRSVSLVLAYLMLEDKMTFADAWSLVATARPVAQPNEGFWKQLEALAGKP